MNLTALGLPQRGPQVVSEGAKTLRFPDFDAAARHSPMVPDPFSNPFAVAPGFLCSSAALRFPFDQIPLRRATTLPDLRPCLRWVTHMGRGVGRRADEAEMKGVDSGTTPSSGVRSRDLRYEHSKANRDAAAPNGASVGRWAEAEADGTTGQRGLHSGGGLRFGCAGYALDWP
eukprot:CAMPEP_0174375878 /NCGR_PEP_ID=MMETSP0811_2-20130205/116131_1 /TAXON_ID=73025 ORGANISM="Eutreptiella gymnastica-like, Strain CCMP1594" /NCGR_SAMPLE_ID=MMETSP0811_2 /ASSEMBLY_ACC=CAM_ASM_000667 /LENGTH=172 /DNA_ID=CAMNT_0015526539 /DNA_START=361 /DNA_END=877 /DNA_ORIENTATION=+